MKIKPVKKSYAEVVAMPKEHHVRPMKQSWFFRKLLQLVSLPDLMATKFSYEKIGMDRLGKDEPALILMNHSSFIDLEIVASMLYPKPFNIVATTDGFIGKNRLMRLIGCIPTKKFVHDTTLLKDMAYALHELKSSVVMFPEAGYSFDGTATQLPDTLGRCAKLMGVPIVVITTHGAFSRDPLYNNLQRRKVDVSATMEYLVSPDELKTMSAEEINEKINEKFSFDSFRWQQENHIKISEPFRADCLNRVLYKCPSCRTEGKMLGKGNAIQCTACGRKHFLTEYGKLVTKGGKLSFSHIPEWYAWEREELKREIEEGRYSLDVPVDICVSIDTKRLYHVGEGRLTHTEEGFSLSGCDGKLEYKQRPLASYTVNSDFNWYEISDVIGIGNNDILYYCFPKNSGDIVAKTRLATEELYKIVKARRRRPAESK